jgi:hypothetical protein
MTDSKNATAHRASMPQPETPHRNPNGSSAPLNSLPTHPEPASQSAIERKKHPRKMFRLEHTPILYFQQLRSHFN